ncbi:MAG: hypothetical protein WC901_04945 [Candidatus Margulisiibacteriota bacterium]
MKRKVFLAWIMLALFMFSGMSYADTQKVADNRDAKIGGQVFFRWQKYTENGETTANNFDVERAYIDVKKKLGSGASARITLDVARLNNDTRKNLFDYLKYAYVDIPINLSASLQPIPYDLIGKIGLQHTVWIDWDDKVMGLRWIAKSLVDNEGVMSSADFGLGAKGKISVAGLPEIEYHATVLNGSGYATTEGNSAKNLDLRLNASLYKNEEVGEVILGAYSNNVGLASSGLTATDSRWGGTLAFKNDWSTVYGEYLTGTTVNGYSAGAWLGLPAAFRLFARKDYYDPNVNTANNQLDRLFYGVIYDLSNDIKFSADMQSVTGGTSASTSAGKTTTAFYLHSLINY